METNPSEIVLTFFPSGATAHRQASEAEASDLRARKNSGVIKKRILMEVHR